MFLCFVLFFCFFVFLFLCFVSLFYSARRRAGAGRYFAAAYTVPRGVRVSGRLKSVPQWQCEAPRVLLTRPDRSGVSLLRV